MPLPGHLCLRRGCGAPLLLLGLLLALPPAAQATPAPGTCCVGGRTPTAPSSAMASRCATTRCWCRPAASTSSTRTWCSPGAAAAPPRACSWRTRCSSPPPATRRACRCSARTRPCAPARRPGRAPCSRGPCSCSPRATGSPPARTASSTCSSGPALPSLELSLCRKLQKEKKNGFKAFLPCCLHPDHSKVALPVTFPAASRLSAPGTQGSHRHPPLPMLPRPAGQGGPSLGAGGCPEAESGYL